MNQEADVADGQFRDFANFLVAEVAMKFQIDDLALIFRKGFQDAEHLTHSFAVFERVGRGRRVDPDSVAEWGHAVLLLSNVECEIATYGEQPLREMAVDEF